MITIKSVSKKYKEFHAINNVSLEIKSNVIYGIIGKSGAGKSTLVRLLSLLETPDAGEIYYDNDRVDNLKGQELLSRRHKIGMIFQNFNLFSSRNVFGNIAYPLEIVKTDKNVIKERVNELLSLVGLQDKYNSPISKLSGGQKQRVAIARALANYPEILFCDEATSALDPQTTKSILQLIKDIQRKMNLTVVMITHQMEVVRDTCDYVSIIDDGNIIETGTVKDVFTFPKSDITRDFLGALKPLEDKDILTMIHPTASRYRLHFSGDTSNKPMLSAMIKQFNIDVNILSGTLHQINQESIGELIIEIVGTKELVDKSTNWLTENGVLVEALS